jgi:hypothetical protein
MPICAVSCEIWKRSDRALRLALDLPTVILYQPGGVYFITG